LQPDFFCKQAGEEAGACADVAHCHARLDLAGRNDVVPLGKNFAAFDLKFSDEFLCIRVLERLIDAGTDALLLTGGRESGRTNKAQGDAEQRNGTAAYTVHDVSAVSSGGRDERLPEDVLAALTQRAISSTS